MIIFCTDYCNNKFEVIRLDYDDLMQELREYKEKYNMKPTIESLEDMKNDATYYYDFVPPAKKK